MNAVADRVAGNTLYPHPAAGLLQSRRQIYKENCGRPASSTWLRNSSRRTPVVTDMNLFRFEPRSACEELNGIFWASAGIVSRSISGEVVIVDQSAWFPDSITRLNS